jgi:hypothetical protein
MRLKISVILLIFFLCFFINASQGILLLYEYSFSTENSDYILVHYWSVGTLPPSLKKVDNPFPGKDKIHAYFILMDKEQGKIVLKKRSYLFTYGWIDPDSEYIVLLSDIDLAGVYKTPIQLALLSIKGKLIFKTAISSEESVLNLKEYNDFKRQYPEYTKKLIENDAISSSYDLKTIYVDSLVDIGYEKRNRYLMKKLKKNHLSECFSEYIFFDQISFWFYHYLDFLGRKNYERPTFVGNPKIKLIKNKSGNVVGISLLDKCKKRFMVPITKKNKDGILVPIK